MKSGLPLGALVLILGCETPSGDRTDRSKPPPHLDPNRRDWWDRSLGDRQGKRAYHVATLTNKLGEIIIWARDDGTIQDRFLDIVANPVRPGQHQQRKLFREHDSVPRNLYFDLNLVPLPQPEGTGNKNVNINVNRR